MKKTDRLALLAWPALAAATLVSLFAGLLLLPGLVRIPREAPPRPPAVRYSLAAARENIPPEENIQVRTLFASDLFASTRLSRRMAFVNLTNSFNRPASDPTPPPLYAAEPILQAAAKTPRPECLGITAEGEAFDLPFQAPPRRERPGRGSPQFLVELRGGLKGAAFSPSLLRDIPIPAGNSPRTMEARVFLDASGYVRQVLADAGDFEPETSGAIMKKIYRERFETSSGPREGTVIISYPAYAAAAGTNAPPGSAP
ncbi:MAG: hypothetical protein WC299_03515 [Kiritimatiellia bacterium]